MKLQNVKKGLLIGNICL